MDQSIIDKIKGLVALSGSSNLNEASVAWEMAQKLLLKHRLSLADLEEKKGFDNDFETKVLDPGGVRNVRWKSALAHSIAQENGCKTFIQSTGQYSGKKTRLMIIGKPGDIEICTYLYYSIVEQIEYLSNQALAKGQGTGKTFTNNFKMAAVYTIHDRLREAIKEIQKEEGQSHAMVILNNRSKDAETYTKTKYKLKEAANYVTGYDEDGYSLGKKAGEKVSLNKALNS